MKEKAFCFYERREARSEIEEEQTPEEDEVFIFPTLKSECITLLIVPFVLGNGKEQVFQ